MLSLLTALGSIVLPTLMKFILDWIVSQNAAEVNLAVVKKESTIAQAAVDARTTSAGVVAALEKGAF